MQNRGEIVERLDVIAVILYLLCTVVYHGSYYYIMKLFPGRTFKSHMNVLRRAWIEYIIKNKEYLIAVNQLRDLVNINTFLASAILISIGALLNLMLNIDKMENLSILTAGDFELKIALLMLVLTTSFFCYLSSLRNLRIVTMLIPAPPEAFRQHTGEDAVEYLTDKINIASSYYTLGSRGMFYAIPILFWLISTWAFIGVTLLMTLYFALKRDYHRPRVAE
jgi:uncharacterized membrane protein